MRVLVIDSDGILGRAVVKALAAGHDVRTLNRRRTTGFSRPSDLVGDLCDQGVAAAAANGCDAVVDLRTIAAGGGSDLDRIDSVTRGTYNLLTTTPVKRFILISSLRQFERYPIDYRVSEQWAPRPTTAIEDLVCHLSEAAVREIAREVPIKAICLRLGTVVDDDSVRGQLTDPRWLHVDDAVQAIQRALTLDRPPVMHYHPPGPDPEFGWWLFHVPGGGEFTRFPLELAAHPPFNYAPHHDLTGGEPNTVPTMLPAAPHRHNSLAAAAHRVVIYGAGGPLAASTTEVLARDHMLRLADVRPLADIAAGKPQKFGAPLPRVLEPPHETRIVDVTDYDQVLDATRGMDAIINCAVARDDPERAFRVNVLGAYNIAKAAVATGIPRVVQTGPQQTTHTGPAGYWNDFGLSADLPGRPGAHLYILSKFLGHELFRIFSEEHDLQVPLLLFSELEEPSAPPEEPFGAFPFIVSWNDAGLAMRQALHVPTLPHRFEPFHITADMPHGKFTNDKAKDLLKWQPLDRFESHYARAGWTPQRN